MARRILAIGLVAIMFCSLITTAQPFLASAEYVTGYLEGEAHGENDAPLANIVWGWLFGLLDVLVIAISDTDVPYSRTIMLGGRSDEYILGYVYGYQEGRSRQRLAYSAVGWGLWVCTLLVLTGGY